ncbi:putative alpha/beta superfamily hydrolase [Sinorhizobium kostiense]|uniref:Alpha/beta superfamily hydrolase n=1 Tax=Sinorhizobium kostiense TaxID=76747 RepID=A0ABS4R1J7_9HYPH|nr:MULTISPECIES: alpha/beta hydrolase-fold protein [Sinorhizobium]MBP2236554.1 putative alpha/beta superfamily hydrolase [Sinorhizobium kostiense]
MTIELPDPVSGRRYEIYVSLPAGYSVDTLTSYPLIIIADGGRAFPKLSCDARMLQENKAIGPVVVVGLSYALGENLEDSRQRDYTPSPLSGSGKVYGGAAGYQRYVRGVVIRYVEEHYRIAPDKRIFWGHSYGGLLGAHILFTEPSLFQTYILGSPSFWFGDEAIFGLEAGIAQRQRQLNATVLLYAGGLETSRYDPARKGKTRDMIAGMQKFEERLRSRRYKGLEIVSTVIPGKDHISSVRPGFAWGLRATLAD